MFRADCRRFRCLSGTVFGLLVVPLVCSSRQTSSSDGSGLEVEAGWIPVSSTRGARASGCTVRPATRKMTSASTMLFGWFATTSAGPGGSGGPVRLTV